MRLRAQLIVIPCATFAARARLASGTGELTPIELVALRAIGLGLDDVDSLAQVTGLGTRPTLDLIYDFWLRGYVLVDTVHARVRLAGEAATLFSSGGLEKLATAENNVEVVPLVQELISGAILPHVGRTVPSGTEANLVPTLRTGLDLATVTRPELLDAVQREVDRQSRRVQRDLFVQEAWVEPSQLVVGGTDPGSLPQPRRFLPVWADIQYDVDSERLLFEIVEAPDLSLPVRQDVARTLTSLAERMPDHLFFKRLRQSFERAPVSELATGGEDALLRLGRAVVGLEATDRGVVEGRHHQLQQFYDDAFHHVRAIARAEADSLLVVGYAEHEAEIRRLIEKAERQLVLANPWLRLEALVETLPGARTSWFDLLDDAMSRGVQVFLLWGIAPDSILDVKAATALRDLSAKHGGRLVIPRRSSALHAKFVVRDAHEALVTSYNFLDPPQTRDSLELGVLVRGSNANHAPEAVLDLLEWSRDAFPDYTAAMRMLLMPGELGAGEAEAPSLPLAPEAPTLDTTPQLGDRPAPAIKHWADAWQSVFDRLVAASRESSRGAYLVVDREHRESLWQALRMSDTRLAVLSDRVSVDVVSDRFVRMLKTRLDAQVPCVFVFRREGATDQEDGPAGRLRRESDRVPDLCRLVEARSHAKVLVSDDEATIGSFNFLSYGGDYATGERERAELSIRLRDPSVVDRVVSLLEDNWPGNFAGLAKRRGTAEQLRSPAQVPPRLQPLFRAMSGPARPGPALLDWFRSKTHPWEDLDALERVGVSADELHRAGAAALACCEDVESEEARRWRARLAMDRWNHEDFIGSALLLPDEVVVGCSLRPWLALLGAATEGAAVRDAAVSLDAIDATPSQARAATALLVVAVLVQGNHEALDTLDQLALDMTGPAATWADAVRAYYESTYQALPIALLRQRAGREQRRAEISEAKTALGRDLESAENVGFRFPLGEHTWNQLKTEGCLLGELRLAHARDDVERLARFLDSVDRAGKDPESLMDAASYAVRDEHNSRIDEPKRSACLKRLTRAVQSARAWIELARSEAPDPAEARVLAACEPLRRALDGLRVDAADEADELSGPALRHARARLAPLFAAVAP